MTDKIVNPTHKQHKYDLIALSNHIGGLGSGHYTTKALNNDCWCDFNDSIAFASIDALPESFISREAYILYYRRRDLDSQIPTTSLNTSSSSTILRSSSRLAAAAGTFSSSESPSPSKRIFSENSHNKMDID